MRGSLKRSSTERVRTSPGQMAVTVMPRGARSSAIDFANRITPALDAAKSARPGSATSPLTLALKTIAPPGAIVRATARATKNAPVRLTSTTRRNASTDIANTSWCSPGTAALTNAASIAPSRSRACAMACSTSSSWVTSHAAPPAAATSPRARATLSVWRPMIHTAAPSPANRLAAAKPIPAVPPEMTMPRPSWRARTGSASA